MSKNIEMIKSQGSGNDFILIDIRDDAYFSENMKKKLAIELCDRENSVGADGILYVDNGVKADCKMRIFNADGSEAEMCGNGIRIVGRYIAEDKKASAVTVENVTGLIYKISNVADFFDDIVAYQVVFPTVSMRTIDLPIAFDAEKLINQKLPEISEKYSFTGLAMPNPHIIAHVDTIDENELITIGEKANSNKSIFPHGVNVSFVRYLTDNKIYVATFERGVGITFSCGTAMCASVVSSIVNGHLDFSKPVQVLNKGGFIFVEVNEDLSCKMTGNSSYVFKGILSEQSRPDNFELILGDTFSKEVKDYQNLVDSTHEIIQKYDFFH